MSLLVHVLHERFGGHLELRSSDVGTAVMRDGRCVAHLEALAHELDVSTDALRDAVAAS